MASGQEMPGVMGKMGVSERVQKNQGRTHTYAHGSHAKQGVRAGTHAHTGTHARADFPYILWAPRPH